MEEVLKSFNLFFSEEDLRKRLSYPLDQIFAPWEKEIDISVAITRYLQIYDLNRTKKLVLMPGVRRELNLLKKHGHEVFIVSAKKSENVEFLVDFLHLEVDGVFGNCNIDGKSEVLKELQCAVYIGDHPNDVLSARKVPCYSVITLTGESTLPEFERSYPDLLVRNLVGICGVLFKKVLL
jgi:phosphoglycolate phosphatase-like HAD superfamily hydrolase